MHVHHVVTRRVKTPHKKRHSFREDARLFNEAFDKVFLAKRPWLRSSPRSFLGQQWDGGPQRGRPVIAGVADVARFYLGLHQPVRGTLRQLCSERGLNYHTVRSYCVKLRRGERPAVQRRAA